MWWFIAGFVAGFAVGALSLAVALVKRQQQAQKDDAPLG